MPPTKINPRLLSWASEIDEATLDQAQTLSQLHILDGPVALMADAHWGMGATIGSVIATSRAIIPSAVGVDIGCGMVAARTSLHAAELPDNLDPLLGQIERAIPAGLGEWHREPTPEAEAWLDRQTNFPATELSDKQIHTALVQLGTLGSGNHFVEVCLDENDHVWVVLHSGSRGIGNQLAQHHIKTAQRIADNFMIPLPHKDLAYFTTAMPEFRAYIEDLRWSQNYAMANRELMMDAGLRELFRFVGTGHEAGRINCHHNYTEREHHHGRDVWVTRKGAVRAREGDLAVIPGSMGAGSYITRGKGNSSSYHSSSHGAGRRMSRGQARKNIAPERLVEQMGGRSWLGRLPEDPKEQARVISSLLDEAPDAYKDIDQVMFDQRDLVEPVHTLRSILNYKGTKERQSWREEEKDAP